MKKNQKSGICLETWRVLSVCEQMARIGDEVMRVGFAMQKRGNEVKDDAAYRMFHLVDVMIQCHCGESCVKELRILDRVLRNWVWGDNRYGFEPEKYFLPFALAARKHV